MHKLAMCSYSVPTVDGINRWSKGVISYSIDSTEVPF